MPSYTLKEAREQAIKAGAYFAQVLNREGKNFLATRIEGVTVVIAVGAMGDKLEATIKGGLFGKRAVIHYPPGEPMPERKPPPESTSPPAQEDKIDGTQPVVLIPLYHEPKEGFAHRQAYVHLHVLNDAKLKRRVRKSGECLCSKKRGSTARSPEPGETTVCPQCKRVAEQNGLIWSLA